MKKNLIVFLLFFNCTFFLCEAQIVTTFAGSGSRGLINGIGTSATFKSPYGITLGNDGNIYVSEPDTNNVIRKITPAAEVTTYYPTTDQILSADFFLEPEGAAIDAAKNVYIVEAGKSQILKITPAGVISIFAGSGQTGSANGTGTAASFKNPSGIAFDVAGNAYVTDAGNHMIRKITPGGVVTTFAGSGQIGAANGTGTAASFYYPAGIAVDPSGNVYIAERILKTVRKITPQGVVSDFVGSLGQSGSANGTGTAATFSSPEGLVTDATGNIYVADGTNNLIRKITPAGVVTNIAGSGAAGAINGSGTGATFNMPEELAIDASGNLYVTERYNNMIRKITPAGVVTTLAGSGQQGSANGVASAASFNGPFGIAVDGNGNVFVADRMNDIVRKITADLVTTFAENTPYISVKGICRDLSGNMYVTNGWDRIFKISAAGTITTFAGANQSGFANGAGSDARFYGISGIAIDGSGNIFVTEGYNNMIRKITPAGTVTTVAGSGDFGAINGTGTAASFYYPQGIAVSASGNIYVADSYNNLIRKITPSGVVTTLAGSGEASAINGIGIAASFNFPIGLAVDIFENVYVADSYNNMIRKITPDGLVTTLAGSGQKGSVNGVGGGAQFYNPTGVVFDASGNLFVADKGNSLIRKITFTNTTTAISAMSGIAEIKIFPVPASNQLTFAFTLKKESVVKIELINADGSKFISIEETLNVGYNERDVLTHQLPAGLYVANIYANGEMASHKVIITK